MSEHIIIIRKLSYKIQLSFRITFINKYLLISFVFAHYLKVFYIAKPQKKK